MKNWENCPEFSMNFLTQHITGSTNSKLIFHTHLKNIYHDCFNSFLAYGIRHCTNKYLLKLYNSWIKQTYSLCKTSTMYWEHFHGITGYLNKNNAPLKLFGGVKLSV